MNASKKQPKTRSCATINVTPLAPAATKIANPKNGYSVHDTDVTYNGQRLYPGVWMHYSTRTEEGEETASHKWLCGPLYVDAITRNCNVQRRLWPMRSWKLFLR
ncbi:hypothetical protein [Stutzerimonas frequens]|uniref:hypothetical protein n=1 Tax=Stutzerimonas frequens TaxID=2968969 RepID=UPI002554D602|nr:hypothetical protein [Stutzerimonas frequens]MDL0438225.1 hypothetical protein [Stutzerimonas frequens]